MRTSAENAQKCIWSESTEGIPMIRFYCWGHYEVVFVPPVSLVEVLYIERLCNGLRIDSPVERS